MRPRHAENHRSEHVGWLRAAVLGANDGIISVAGLVVGVAASGASHGTVLASGIAAVVAGAMSTDAEAEINERVYRLFKLTPDEVALLKREVEH